LVVVVVVVVVVDFDGDGDVEVDATVDGQIILVSIAVMTLRSRMTSSDAAHSIASPRAIL
jgi:hypothetical protein